MKQTNWRIDKDTLDEITDKFNDKKYNNSFDLILDLYIKLLKKGSNKTYSQVTNALLITDAFQTDAEQHFMVVLPKLIVEGRSNDAIKLIGLIRRSACLYLWEETEEEKEGEKKRNKRSYKTYIRTFVDFLEKFIVSDANNKRSIIGMLQKLTTMPLSPQENQYLKDAFESHHVFLHDRLHTKFKQRLNSQRRTSGDKIWLPLQFISKIYNNNKGYTNWLDSLVDDIYIHYMDIDDNNNETRVKSVSFNQDVFLDFEKIEEDKYDVYIIWSRGRKPKRRRVYTPTGKGNEKVPMTVSDISDIDIDHVKSIDSTLRDLEGKFQVLKIVSEIFKRVDKAFRKDNADIKQLTSNALKEIKENNDFVIDKLTEELNLIKKDSILRLMNSEYNKKKSNGESFEKIIKTKESYLGIVLSKVTFIENNPEDKNNHSDYSKEDITIYQDLAENGIMLAKRSSQMDKGRKVKITKKLVDYI